MALGCVPLSAYCQSHGESSEQVKKRIQRGVWRIGVQVLEAPVLQSVKTGRVH